jgi:hypothetical protein
MCYKLHLLKFMLKCASYISVYKLYSFTEHSYIEGVPGVKVTTSGFNSRADSESKILYTRGSNSQRFRSYGFLKKVNKLEKMWSIVHSLRYVVTCTYKFTVQHSTKLFEVSICLDTFSDSCDQRTALQCFVRLEVLWSHESENVSKQMENTSNNLVECWTVNL